MLLNYYVTFYLCLRVRSRVYEDRAAVKDV